MVKEQLQYNVRLAFNNVKSIIVSETEEHNYNSSWWKSCKITINFNDGTSYSFECGSDHVQEKAKAELLVACIEAKVAERLQLAEAKLAIIEDTCKG
jgi:hypothetical protein